MTAATSLAGRYHARLDALTLCPVCGAAAAPSGRVPNLRRFACGSAFGYSKITMAIEAADPCPVPSRIQANQLSAEAAEAATPYRPQVKSAEERAASRACRERKAGAA